MTNRYLPVSNSAEEEGRREGGREGVVVLTCKSFSSVFIPPG